MKTTANGENIVAHAFRLTLHTLINPELIINVCFKLILVEKQKQKVARENDLVNP